jgi:diaminopimelate epimerase
MQGLGNDYVVIDIGATTIEDPAGVARRLCDRRLGVGADGMLLVGRHESADLSMRVFNADGSEPEMCGNGLRCAVRFGVARGLVRTGDLQVATGAGILAASAAATGPVTIDLGASRRPLETCSMPEGEAILVDLGNPHAVIRLESPAQLAAVDVARLGEAISGHPRFERGINVERVARMEASHLLQRTWERGVGETPACGTGAGAVALALHHLGLCGERVTIGLTGGELEIELRAAADGLHAWQTGPAEMVFEATLIRD